MDATVAERRKSRKHDILLLGATGYTGSLTAEYIARYLPTDLKWAIAGRSRSKLEALAKKLNVIDSKRSQPVIEVVSLENGTQLDSAIKDSKVCISVVSYHQIGETVVRSCIENGTDYLDVAGDVPLLRKFVDKYHEAAINARVALIHVCGVFSAPHDLLAWATVRKLAEETSLKAKEVVLSVTELELSPSGGTAQSLMADSTHDPQAFEQAKQPWILSPFEGTQTSASTNLLGIRQERPIGLLSASSISAGQNRAVVHRTWGLLQGTNEEYGPNFQFNEYDKVSSTAAGLLRMLNTALLNTLLGFKLFRSVAKLFLPAPGEGPDVEKTRHSRIKFEAVAIADVNDESNPPRAYASFSYPSGAYHTTALFLAQGAASLLYTRSLEGRVAGGCLTPAFLGGDLIRRVQEAGATFKVNLI